MMILGYIYTKSKKKHIFVCSQIRKYLMRILFTWFIGLLITFSGLAQKKQLKKNEAILNSNPTEAITTSKPLQDKEEDIVIDTIHIVKGKPTLLLVQVEGQNTANSKDHREIKELHSNFDKTKLDIINITRHSFILFENNQTLEVSGIKNSYGAKAYWSGKLKEPIQTEEGIQNATEFFAKQLKIKKESSYITNAKKYKKELGLLLKKNMMSEAAKAAMNTFLNRYTTALDNDLGELHFFNQNDSKVKSITTYIPEKKDKKQLIKTIEFNELGQPLTIKKYKEDQKLESHLNFEYTNGILAKIKKGDSTTIAVSYYNDKMIFIKKTETTTITKLFWLEDNELLEKEFTLYHDDNLAYHNTIIEDKLENSCKIRFYNDEVIRKDCFTKKDEIPFIYTYISYQDEEILQFYKVKLIKKNDTTYEKYISETNNPKEYKDNFKLVGSYQLNDKKQLSAFKFMKDKAEKNIKIAYTYFP